MIAGALALALVLCGAPASAFADTVFTPAAASAWVGALSPASTVGVGTTVTFSVVTAGFTNPTYQAVDSFGGGVSDVNLNLNGDFSWTPNNSDLGTHTITITVSDLQGDKATASQTITVATPGISVNSLLPGATVRFGNQLTFSAGSVGFYSPQYTVADSYPYSTVSSANTDNMGNFHWTPVFQDIGTHILTVTARDYLGHLATTSQQITVTGPLTVAIGPVSPASVHVGDAVSFTATTTGFTGPAFAVSDAFTSSLGTSTLKIDTGGKATWTPNANDIGTHIMTISVTDSSGDAGSAHTTIAVLQGSGTSYIPAVTPYVPATAPVTPSTPTASAQAYTFKKLLTVGSSGADVTALQQLLVQLGFLQVTPTGYFGAMTKAALQKYQSAHGISPLGYAGPLTRTSLSLGK